ncbi:MAG: hypothetical protein K2J02_04120 [Malacoplasma sp.]|nr:hypothetical protein [Malacoplasma sp.]
MIKNKKIIQCKITEIHSNYIVAENKDKKYICNESQISDFKVNLNEYFSVGKIYKFCLVNNKYISYKIVRPKLLKNKKAPIPTISGPKNLEKHLLNIINKK